jgi:hypothetical protein
MHIEMRRVQKSSLVEDAGLAPGRAQRAAVAGGRRRRQELAPAAPGEEAAAVGALLLRGRAEQLLSPDSTCLKRECRGDPQEQELVSASFPDQHWPIRVPT